MTVELLKTAQEALNASVAAQEQATQALAAAQKTATDAAAALTAAQKTATDAAAADKAAQEKAAAAKTAADTAVAAAKVTPEQEQALASAQAAVAATERKVIEDLYVRTLSRQPTETEFGALLPLFAEGSNADQSFADVFWALLNSREFLFNH